MVLEAVRAKPQSKSIYMMTKAGQAKQPVKPTKYIYKVWKTNPWTAKFLAEALQGYYFFTQINMYTDQSMT